MFAESGTRKCEGEEHKVEHRGAEKALNPVLLGLHLGRQDKDKAGLSLIN